MGIRIAYFVFVLSFFWVGKRTFGQRVCSLTLGLGVVAVFGLGRLGKRIKHAFSYQM
jgi:hypothetical protein